MCKHLILLYIMTICIFEWEILNRIELSFHAYKHHHHLISHDDDILISIASVSVWYMNEWRTQHPTEVMKSYSWLIYTIEVRFELMRKRVDYFFWVFERGNVS